MTKDALFELFQSKRDGATEIIKTKNDAHVKSAFKGAYDETPAR